VIIESFSKSFKKMQSDKKHPRFRDVPLTVPRLYENVFHPGNAFDAENLALTLPELGLFFKRFRVSLFVLDITQRVIYSEVFKEKSKGGPGPWLDEKIRPNSVYVMQHGAHLYRLTDLKELQQKAHNERAVIHAPLKPFEDLGEEREFNAPTEHYSLGGDEPPVVFGHQVSGAEDYEGDLLGPHTRGCTSQPLGSAGAAHRVQVYAPHLSGAQQRNAVHHTETRWRGC
jgi:hypothetical protein